jgi:tetratricopeptide (TPR) repeat protein
MENDVQQGGEGGDKPESGISLKVVMTWVGAATAVLGLIGGLSGWFHTFSSHRTERAELNAQMAVAQEQAKQGEYPAAVRSYRDILKRDPLYAPALEGQLDAAMLWVENFDVLVREGKDASDAAGPLLDEIMPVLDSGLARSKESKGSKGPRAADVQAHLGWAHWLNWHIAEREFSPLAEKNLRAAVDLDKANVYGNAMLGNWMLQNNRDFQEAIGHLNTALGTGKARPLVREMQIGGLLNDEKPGARAELVKAVNDMRKNGEAIEDEERYRIRSFCYNTSASNHANLVESLSAVPEEDSWKTFLWLDDNHEDRMDPLARDFIHANLLEVSGNRSEALEKFRALQRDAKAMQFSFKGQVDDAVKRLTKG